jgi:hypothetical protein
MKDLQSQLSQLEEIAGTYCLGKVEGEINTPIIGEGSYYAYAKGTTYLAESLIAAVELAIDNVKVRVA